MPSPQELTNALQQLANSLPGRPRDLLPNRAAAMRIYTVDEAMQWFEQLANFANETSRLPIATECSRNPNGTLTITVTPG